MRIERPRTPHVVVTVHKGRPKEQYRMGYGQHEMLGLLMDHGRSEKPKKGVLTPTGLLREHILNDMIPLGWVKADVVRPGITDYLITAFGRKAYHNAKVADPPKVSKARSDGRESVSTAPKAVSGLLARQRARAAAKRRAGTGAEQGRRAATG